RRLLALHAEQFDVEDQRGVRRYQAARAASAIPKCWRNDEGALAADLHRGDAFIPTGDDLLLPDGKLERLTAIDRTVEFLAPGTILVEPAGVVHDANLAGFGRGARPDFDVRDLKSRWSGHGFPGLSHC